MDGQNPVRGCSRVSEGCRFCYAERMASRFSDPGMYAHGYAERTPAGPRWTGKVSLVPEKLAEPLSWRRPRRVFVNSMSDLFHEGLSNEAIAAVFGVMAACPHHVFQVLTKRAARLPDWFAWAAQRGEQGARLFPDDPLDWRIRQLCHVEARRVGADLNADRHQNHGGPWPLPNVWLGVSVEDQQRADERIPFLLQTPAAVCFLSCEPLLGPLTMLSTPRPGEHHDWLTGEHESARGKWSGPRINWMIVGGESGPGSRPMDVAWMRSIKDQCEAAGVPYFGKQLGARPVDAAVFRWLHHSIVQGEERLYGPRNEHAATLWKNDDGRVTWHTWDPKGVGGENGVDRDLPTAKAEALKAVMRAAHFPLRLKDKKGGDPAEWSEDLRVRQFPEVPRG